MQDQTRHLAAIKQLQEQIQQVLDICARDPDRALGLGLAAPEVQAAARNLRGSIDRSVVMLLDAAHKGDTSSLKLNAVSLTPTARDLNQDAIELRDGSALKSLIDEIDEVGMALYRDLAETS